MKNFWWLAAKINLCRWFWDDGDNTHLLGYNLKSESLVFDVGGCIGNFSDKIISRFNPEIYIFEPVKPHYLILKGKYKGSEKAKIYNIGLSDKTERKQIGVKGDSSSVFVDSDRKEEIKLVDVVEFMETHNVSERIDLMSINIEGGEYSLLKRIIESGLIKRVENLQVQFHHFVPLASEMREKLLQELHKTHEAIFSYPFVWEGFRKKR